MSMGNSVPSEPPPRPGAATVDLVALLAPALGADKAREVVLAAARSFRFAPMALSQAQALTVLEQLAATPGIVGVVCRFAKARVLLSGP